MLVNYVSSSSLRRASKINKKTEQKTILSDSSSGLGSAAKINKDIAKITIVLVANYVSGSSLGNASEVDIVKTITKNIIFVTF